LTKSKLEARAIGLGFVLLGIAPAGEFPTLPPCTPSVIVAGMTALATVTAPIAACASPRGSGGSIHDGPPGPKMGQALRDESANSMLDKSGKARYNLDAELAF
jgi:hypothetical protein